MGVEAVVLAAGFSSRTHNCKMALDFGGKSMLQRNIEAMYNLCCRIIVVGGHQIEKIKELVKPYDQVEVINNEKYAQGMFSSVKKGITAVQEPLFFFTPGDYPLLTEGICRSLLQASLLSEQSQVVIPKYQGRKGHPILLHSDLIPEILNEPQNSNLKIFIQKKQCTLIEIEDVAILKDVDTLEDYNQAIALFQQRGGRV